MSNKAKYPILERTLIPSIDPKEIYKEKPFSSIRQGKESGYLNRQRFNKDKPKQNTQLDIISNQAIIKDGDFYLAISNYTQRGNLRTSAHQLLDILMVKFTESGAENPKIVIPLKEYMEIRKLKDRKTAKIQVSEALLILKGISITKMEQKTKKEIDHFNFVNIADSGSLEKNGDIVFTLAPSFFRISQCYSIMPYPNFLSTVNNKRNPHSYSLGWKITQHKYMNKGKPTEDIISVKTLLKCCPELPTYEEVKNGDRHYIKRIIMPFERDMDALSPNVKWGYCKKNGLPLTDQELATLDYHSFLKLNVKLEWDNYPDIKTSSERRSRGILKKSKAIKE